MVHIGPYVRYDAITDGDPFTSVVAAHGNIIVAGTLYGDLYLIYGDKRELIYTHHGSVVEVQVRKCHLEQLSDHVCVVCATSLGYIYAHLVSLTKVSDSRVIYKLRTGHNVIGLALHPKFVIRHRVIRDRRPRGRVSTDLPQRNVDGGIELGASLIGSKEIGGETSNEENADTDISPNNVYKVASTRDTATTTTNKRRETYDLRNVIMSLKENRSKRLGDMKYTDSSVVFALQNGGVYLLMLDKISRNGPERACNLLHKSTEMYRGIPMVWYRDMIAWADEDGTHVFLLPKGVTLAFLPHQTPLETNDGKLGSLKGCIHLQEVLDMDEFYVTSDESEVEDTEKGCTDNAISNEGKDILDQITEMRTAAECLQNLSYYKYPRKVVSQHTIEEISIPQQMAHLKSKSVHTLRTDCGSSDTDISTSNGSKERTDGFGITIRGDVDSNSKPVGQRTTDAEYAITQPSNCSTRSDTSNSTSCANDCDHMSSEFQSKGDLGVEEYLSETAIPVTCKREKYVAEVDLADDRNEVLGNNKMCTAIRLHGIPSNFDTSRIQQRESLGVVICWLTRRKLLVGVKNVLRIVDLLPACVEEMDDVFNNNAVKGRIKLLDIEKRSNQTEAGGISQLVFMVKKRETRAVPLRGRLSYTFTGPQTYRIVAIMRHPNIGNFSVAYVMDKNLSRVEISHTKKGYGCSSFEVVDRNEVGANPNASVSADLEYDGQSCYTFTAFDVCYSDLYLNDTFVRCLNTNDGKQVIRQQAFLHVSCRITRQILDICSTTQVTMNHFCCNDVGNVQHCLAIKQTPKRTFSDRPIDALLRGNNKSMDRHTGNNLIECNIPCGVLHCFSDPENFEGICLVNRGLILSITGATMTQHFSQECEHGNYHHALKEIMHISRSFNVTSNWETYVHDHVQQGLESMLSSRYLDVKKIACFIISYLQFCIELMDSRTYVYRVRELVSTFAAHRRLNVLLGYVLQGQMLSITNQHTIVSNIVLPSVFDVLQVDMPFVLLRLAVTKNLNVEQIRLMLRLLKDFVSDLTHKCYFDSVRRDEGCEYKFWNVYGRVEVGKCDGGAHWILTTKPIAISAFDPENLDYKETRQSKNPKTQMGYTLSNLLPPLQGDVCLQEYDGARYSRLYRTGSLISVKAIVEHSVDVYEWSYGGAQRSELLRAVEEIDLELVDATVSDSVAINEIYSDYELLRYLTHSSKDFLESSSHMDYGPRGRAAMMAIAALLSKVGRHNQAFKFLLLAQSSMAVELAKILCDMEPAAYQDVMRATLQLYRIHPQMTNEMAIERFNTPDCIKVVVKSLSLEPRFLFSYLNGIQSEAKLSLEYLPLYFGLLCLFKPIEATVFVKQWYTFLKSDQDLVDHFIKVIMEARRMLVASDTGGKFSSLEIQKELYLAESFLRWIGGQPWDQVYSSVMLALRLDFVHRDDSSWEQASAKDIHRRLLPLLCKTFDTNAVESVYHRIVKEYAAKGKADKRYADTAMELYLCHLRSNTSILSAQYTSCVGSMRRISNLLLKASKRGIVFSGTQRTTAFVDSTLDYNEEQQVAEDYGNGIAGGNTPVMRVMANGRFVGQVDPANNGEMTSRVRVKTLATPKVSNVYGICNRLSDGDTLISSTNICVVCNSLVLATHWDMGNAAHIVDTIRDHLVVSASYLQQPTNSNMIYFFCGHVMHEFCQIRLINQAVSLRLRDGRERVEAAEHTGSSQIGSYRCKSGQSENLRSACLVCLHDLKGHA
ncbi:uncharacterized protein BXIN_2867 [Babesia sp. Xinjiang]|uniref:uncharacterized protein n=1 Tax=Babesia sp. Xinjiang TaxID=462227 RepID=UPI000A25E996|nr:uncharacterized protein BXIN_2867 [Babesia sp. Xinjiang]ORM39564.1 hypothetical protein BXIN_2867 [Babesia sp. Xinjiang]